MKAGITLLALGLFSTGFAYTYYQMPSAAICLSGGGALLVVGGFNHIFHAMFGGQ